MVHFCWTRIFTCGRGQSETGVAVQEERPGICILGGVLGSAEAGQGSSARGDHFFHMC